MQKLSLILVLALASSQAQSAAFSAESRDHCQSLQRRLSYVHQEIRYSSELVNGPLKELKEDAAKTATASRLTAAASLGLFVGASALSIEAAYASATAVPLGMFEYGAAGTVAEWAHPISYLQAFHAAGQYVTTKVDAALGLKSEAKNVRSLWSFERRREQLRRERAEVDLDWSRVSNGLTLGGIAERRTAKLYEISKAERQTYLDEAEYIQELFSQIGCHGRAALEARVNPKRETMQSASLELAGDASRRAN